MAGYHSYAGALRSLCGPLVLVTQPACLRCVWETDAPSGEVHGLEHAVGLS